MYKKKVFVLFFLLLGANRQAIILGGLCVMDIGGLDKERHTRVGPVNQG